MKWLVGVLAAISMFSFARADSDTLEAAWQSKQNECAWYRGSFDKLGVDGPYRDSLPKVFCRFVNGVGVRCILKDHAIKTVNDPLELRGNFKSTDTSIIAETTDTQVNVFKLRVICEQGSGCFMQFWNSEKMIGYSCNLETFKVPAKPAPEPPPLLKKPAQNNTADPSFSL